MRVGELLRILETLDPEMPVMQISHINGYATIYKQYKGPRKARVKDTEGIALATELEMPKEKIVTVLVI